MTQSEADAGAAAHLSHPVVDVHHHWLPRGLVDGIGSTAGAQARALFLESQHLREELLNQGRAGHREPEFVA